jgi:hypothetical protein
VQRQGAYWYELDKSKNILRHGGPFETLLDAASDVGKSDYYLPVCQPAPIQSSFGITYISG